MEWVVLLVQLVGTAATICAVVSVAMATYRPRSLMNLVDELGGAWSYRWQDHKLAWGFFGLCLIGFGVFVNGGVFVALSWMPYGWGGVNEDGDFTSVRWYAAMLLAFLAAYPALSATLQFAELNAQAKDAKQGAPSNLSQ